MACPDELTLDLWLADALPLDEAGDVADHVRACARCMAAKQAASAANAELHAALDLDADEREYLRGLDLTSSWRAQAEPAALSWGWILLVGVVAAFAAWLVAAPTFGSAVALAVQVGLESLLLNTALGLVFSVGQVLLDVIRNPALSLNQPLLALLALVLLFWPRQLIRQRSAQA